MSENALKSNLFSLLKQLEPHEDSTDKALVFEGVTTNNSAQLEVALEYLGYNFIPNRSIRGSKLYIQIIAPAWKDGECPIYFSWEDLYLVVSQKLSIPKFYLILSELNKEDGLEECHEKRLQVLCGATRLLARISDHCEPSSGSAKGSERLLFLIESESDTPASRYDFKPEIKWEQLLEINNLDQSLIAISKLDGTLDIDDKQAKERKSVMRSSFGELINKCETPSVIFNYLLGSLVQFQKKYDEYHDMFIQRFSVNKVLHEISKQDLEYTSKINDIVSSGQAKALTIPASLAVIGAVMKIDAVSDAIAVAAGLSITTVMIVKSLSVHNETFTHIKKRIKAEFQRYDNLAEQAEVREQAGIIKKDLSSLVDKASKNLNFVKYVVIGTLALGLAYIAYSTYEASSPTINLSNTFECIP
jgi:hypothetical protein